MGVLKIGLPKGSLQEATFELMSRAGFQIRVGERSYFPTIDDEELNVVLFRAQEMSRYVERGTIDCGLTGRDWVLENGSDVVEVEQLRYGKAGLSPVRWVLAVPEESPINSVEELRGKRIATEVVNLTRRFLEERGVNATVEFSWGATEAKARAGVVDAIVELTETGSSLRAHRLRVLETVMQSETLIIANKEAWKDSWKRTKIEGLALLLRGAVVGRQLVGLKMNVSSENLKAVEEILPALKRPTISELSLPGWYALEVVIEEKVAREFIPKLKRAGAEGIIEYPLNKVIF